MFKDQRNRKTTSNRRNVKEIKIEVAGESVVIDKLFGPMVFANLRITPDTKSCSWIIERQTPLPCPDPEDKNTIQWITWVEWCRIPAQFDWEFDRE